MLNRYRGEIYLITGALFFSFNGVISTLVLDHLSPFRLTQVRCIGAFTILFLIVASRNFQSLCASVVGFKAKLVSLRRAHNQAMRQQSSRKKTRKAVVDSGILKPLPLPVEAEVFLKDIGVAIPESNLMRRTEFSAALYEYVKSKSLYKADPSKESGFDRKVIIPDAKIRKLFSLSADQTLDFSTINVNLATIYRRAKELLLASGGAPAAPVAPKAPVTAPIAAAKKGKVAGSSA